LGVLIDEVVHHAARNEDHIAHCKINATLAQHEITPSSEHDDRAVMVAVNIGCLAISYLDHMVADLSPLTERANFNVFAGG